MNVRGTIENFKEWKPEPPIQTNQGYRIIAFWASIFMLLIPLLSAEYAYYGLATHFIYNASLIVIYFTGSNETFYYFFFHIPA